MSSSKKPRMSSIPAGSKLIPRGNKIMNQSKIKRKSTISNSKGSGSKLLESRFMSRMKSSMVGGKYGKSGYRKKGSSKYSTVRENGDPIIYRDGVDMTPLPIQIDYKETNNDEYSGYTTYGDTNKESQCFIPLIDPIYHPMSMSQNDDKKEFEKESLNSIICRENDCDMDTITNLNEFNQLIQNNQSVLDQNIVIEICETETQIIFEMSSLAISNREQSKEERENVIKLNKDYEECLLKHNDKDLFTTSCTQTYKPPMKEQSIDVKPQKTHTVHTQSSKFDIYDALKNDCMHSMETQTEVKHRSTPLVDSEVFKNNLTIMERAIIQNVMAKKQMLYRVHNTDKRNGNDFDSDDETEDKVETKKELKVEIDLTPIDPTMQPQRPESKNENKKPPSSLKHQQENMLSNIPHLQLLWEYSCTECEGLSCTVLDYNPLNTDLIVGGYGSWKFANKDSGKIMFWTLKNPTKPSRIYNIQDTCVVSLNFSRVHPYLLAVGLFDGTVCVYDIRTQSNDPILKSELNSSISASKKQNQASSSKHTTPVWNVLWEKPNNSYNNSNNNEGIDDQMSEQQNSPVIAVTSKLQQRQKVFSIASDGIIKQWCMKKGFISTNIMSLKRVPNLAAKRGSVIDNTIRSRQSSGLCFDFPYNVNNTQYYVGTEDGIVHKCSVSYNEQVLRTYYGHTAPVHRIQCSPFDTNKFITCSADWTINIWAQHKSTPLLQVTSNSNESVVDCCWSPLDSCIFASASESGILSVWNLEKSKKDAIVTKDTKNSIKQILFAPNAPALLSAQSNGTIKVYRLNNINDTFHRNDDISQIERLNKTLQSKS